MYYISSNLYEVYAIINPIIGKSKHNFECEGRKLTLLTYNDNSKLNLEYDDQEIRIKKRIYTKVNNEYDLVDKIAYNYVGNQLISEKYTNYNIRYHYGIYGNMEIIISISVA